MLKPAPHVVCFSPECSVLILSERWGGDWHRRIAFALEQDQPVRALLLIHVEPFAVVAAHALALDDQRPANRAPLAGFLAQLAAVALGPALDPKHGRHLRNDSERRANRTEEA